MSETFVERASTRELIVDMAYRLFINNGYHGTSMRQIAQEAGIAVSGIYNHFSSKEDIFIAALEKYHPFRQIFPAIEQVEARDLETYVRQLVGRSTSILKGRPEFINLLMIEIVEFKSVHVPVLFKVFFPHIFKMVGHLSGMSSQMRDVPPPMAMRALIGMIFAHYVIELLIGENFPPEMVENAIDYNVDIFLHGVMPSPDGRA